MSTYVLVHGSWHGAWNWHKIVPRLEAAGHRAVAIDLPAHGRDRRPIGSVTLQDCVDATCDAIDAQPEPVVLVGHSRSGIVISQAAEARPDRIRRLVYVAAFLVPNGQTMLSYALRDRESLILRNVTVNNAEGSHMLNESAYRLALYADCSDDDVALCTALLAPEPNEPGTTPLRLTQERFGRIPRTYIECLQDRAVSLRLQREMHSAISCDVISMDTGHTPLLSAPDELARHLAAL